MIVTIKELDWTIT